MTIATHERDLYTTTWASIDDYGAHAPGEQYLPLFLDMVGTERGTVLDAGCGSGKGSLALKAAGFTVTLCDMTREGLVADAQKLPYFDQVLWRPIAKNYRWDFAYCCDVLEHLPTQFTMLAVDRLLAALRPGGRMFLSVCNIPDSYGVWVGQPLHQAVQPFTWWRDSFREIARVIEARDLIDNSVFLLART